MGILMTILRTLGGVGLSLLMSLLTEKTLKRMIILGLEKIADKTETEIDNQVLKIAKDAWETPETK